MPYIRSTASGRDLWLAQLKPHVVWDIDPAQALKLEDDEVKKTHDYLAGWRRYAHVTIEAKTWKDGAQPAPAAEKPKRRRKKVAVEA